MVGQDVGERNRRSTSIPGCVGFPPEEVPLAAVGGEGVGGEGFLEAPDGGGGVSIHYFCPGKCVERGILEGKRKNAREEGVMDFF